MAWYSIFVLKVHLNSNQPLDLPDQTLPFFPVLPDPHESEFFTKLKTHITELTDDDDHDNDDHDDNDEDDDIYMDISTAAALLQS